MKYNVKKEKKSEWERESISKHLTELILCAEEEHLKDLSFCLFEV